VAAFAAVTVVAGCGSTGTTRRTPGSTVRTSSAWRPLELDGSGSDARSGVLLKYAWNFDGDGNADQVTATPRLTHVGATKDGDEVSDSADTCPRRADPGQEDTDDDGRGDLCDPSPGWPTEDQPGVSEGTG
jgi:hypothetical protein